MKSNLKKASMLLTGILVGGKLFAQNADTSHMSSDYVKPFSGGNAFSTWSIGVNAGVITPFTIFGSNAKQDFTSPNAKFGYGGYIKDQILPSFGIQADFFAGKLSADHSQPNASGTSPYSNYTTKLNYSASLSGNFTFANINWRHNKPFIQPYITAGAGLLNYSPVLKLADGSYENLNAGTNKTHAYFVPVGLGLKFDLAPGVNLDLGYTVNFVYNDDVDGYAYGSSSDKFSYAHAGLEFSLGGSHKKPQLATHNPVSSMRTEYMWENRNTKNQLQGQIDAEKAKNEQLRNDLNTTNATLAKLTTDSDGDGVPDAYDKCPNTPAGTAVDGSGCPLPVAKQDVKVYVTQQDREVVKEAIRNLEFDFGKATIRDHSYPSLDKVAQLLMDKKFHLKLAGYTDNVGSVNANLKLSKDRAEAIKTYLVGKGADASLIQAEGYGKANPIASNKTAAGRQTNRRVEFSLY